MANERDQETVEQAVNRIAKETSAKLFPKYCSHFNGAYCDVCGPKDIEAALRKMAAWAYRDVAEICRTSESWADTDGRLQAKAREITDV